MTKLQTLREEKEDEEDRKKKNKTKNYNNNNSYKKQWHLQYRNSDKQW